MTDCEKKERRRIHFDGTITLGHVLTALAMIGAMLAMWRNFEIRMTRVELESAYQRDTMKQMATALDKISDRMERTVMTR